MFEKFSNLDVDSAGQGGEYTVQVRFFFFFFHLKEKHFFLNIFFFLVGWFRMDQWSFALGCR